MKFTREPPTAVMISSVSGDGIRIGNEVFSRPIALTHDGVSGEWTEKAIGDLCKDDFAELLQTEPELVVLGTGATLVFVPRQLVFAFARLGIGLEVMDTAAAARTFNVLASEGRRIAAVLYV